VRRQGCCGLEQDSFGDFGWPRNAVETVMEENDTIKTEVVEPVYDLRNFKSSPEVENFYRFVSEYGLRVEASRIFSALWQKVTRRPRLKSKKARD